MVLSRAQLINEPDWRGKPYEEAPARPVTVESVAGLDAALAEATTGVVRFINGVPPDETGDITLSGGSGGPPAWGEITGKPATFPPTLPISIAGVTSLQTALDAKALDSDLDALAGSVVDLSAAVDLKLNISAAFSGAYADLTGKPSLFDGTWGSLSGKPTTFAPASHTHVVSDVTGLQGALDGKQPVGSYALTSQLFSGSYTDLTNKPTLFSGAYADLTGKPDLSGYSLKAGDTFTGPLAVNSNARQINVQAWGDVSARGAGDFILGNNLYGDNDEGTFKTPQAHGSLGYRALRLSTDGIQAAVSAGATTTDGVVSPAWMPIPLVLARRTTATAAIANTETVVIQGVIPAGVLKVGSTIRLSAVGVMTNTTTATTSTWRLRIGTVTLTGAIAASAAYVNAVTARTSATMRVDAEIMVLSIGSAGTIVGQIMPAGGSLGTTPPAGVTTAVAINTTVQNLVEFTFISGGATTTATFHIAYLEIVY